MRGPWVQWTIQRNRHDMNMKQISAAGLMLLASTQGAHAALQGRDLDTNTTGFEAYYDTVLNITWLADANLPLTRGAANQGTMQWPAAQSWVSALNTSGGLYGYTGWHLPDANPINGSAYQYPDADPASGNIDRAWSYSGQSDYGMHITSTASQMSYMFYVNLGLTASYDTSGHKVPGWGINALGAAYVAAADGGYDITANGVTFKNWRFNEDYWTRSAINNDSYLGPSAWTFWTDGTQQILEQTAANNSGNYLWLVHDGDVISSVPEPEAYVLMLAGLGLLGVRARRTDRLVRR